MWTSSRCRQSSCGFRSPTVRWCCVARNVGVCTSWIRMGSASPPTGRTRPSPGLTVGQHLAISVRDCRLLAAAQRRLPRRSAILAQIACVRRRERWACFRKAAARGQHSSNVDRAIRVLANASRVGGYRAVATTQTTSSTSSPSRPVLCDERASVLDCERLGNVDEVAGELEVVTVSQGIRDVGGLERPQEQAFGADLVGAAIAGARLAASGRQTRASSPSSRRGKLAS